MRSSRGFSGDEHAPVVERVAAVRADRHRHAVDIAGPSGRSAPSSSCCRAMSGEGNILRRLGDADDEPGILLREEALRDASRTDRRGQRERGEEDAAASANWWRRTDVEASLIAAQQPLEAALAAAIEPPMLRLVPRGLRKRDAHHRRERQRDDRRNQRSPSSGSWRTRGTGAR